MQSEQHRQRRREQKRLERERQKKEARKAQMCAGDELEFLLPLRVAALFGRTMRVAREEAGRPISPGECLVRMARHFIDIWGPRMAHRSPGAAEATRAAGNAPDRGCRARARSWTEHVGAEDVGAVGDRGDMDGR